MTNDLQPLPLFAPEWARQAEARILSGRATALDRLWTDPCQVMTRAGMTPDPWQARLLLSLADRDLLLCSRQAGKSQAAAALALQLALTQPALILLLSPSQRQSGELFRDKLLRLYGCWRKDMPATRETALTLELANGSRIISLPENEESIRGYSGVNLLVVDEASRVSDELYMAVRPMLAVSRGKLIALSTPFAKRGWFYEEWINLQKRWQRTCITADQCPRIPKEFLAEERKALGERWYRQEYMTSFEDVVGAVFAHEDIERALDDDVQPMFVVGR